MGRTLVALLIELVHAQKELLRGDSQTMSNEVALFVLSCHV